MIILSNELSINIFGNAINPYSRLINDIYPEIIEGEFYFEPEEIFTRKIESGESVAYYNRVVWTEVLYRSRIAAVSAILRGARWIDSVTREYEANNVFGFAGACRSLMEAAGDTGDSLGGIALTLAKEHNKITMALRGKCNDVLHHPKEIEDILIHFTHARKVGRNEEIPESHKAKPSWKYVKYIENMKIEGANELYSELCEIVHPAAMSVHVFLEYSGAIGKFNRETEKRYIEVLAKRCQSIFGGVLMANFNPPILILKVLHQFDLFPPVKALRRHNLSNIPIWREIEKALQK